MRDVAFWAEGAGVATARRERAEAHLPLLTSPRCEVEARGLDYVTTWAESVKDAERWRTDGLTFCRSPGRVPLVPDSATRSVALKRGA